jgi:hypothetical protein
MTRRLRRFLLSAILGASLLAPVFTPPGAAARAAEPAAQAAIFADVHPEHPYSRAIEALYTAGYTAGCGTDPLRFCPDEPMLRSHAAVFSVRAQHGADFLPLTPEKQDFVDVAPSSWHARWINQLWTDGFTAGCGSATYLQDPLMLAGNSDPDSVPRSIPSAKEDRLLFCPDQEHTRAEAAVFGLRMQHGYEFRPSDPSGLFSDVSSNSWAASWLEEAYRNGLLSACATEPQLKICPEEIVSRGEAAHIVARAKGLLPIRAAFYYPWFPEAWDQGGAYPFTNYTPSLGIYDQGDPAVIRNHLDAMQYGKIEAGIASWWGQGHHTDKKLPLILETTAGRDFHWAVYYEQEGFGNPSVSSIADDLVYLREQYASDPAFLTIDGRFVVFVYGGDESCEMTARWQQANTVDAYVVLKVFSGYRNCPNQPDGWHQYAPAKRTDHQDSFSYAISPGFWLSGDPMRLERDLSAWYENVRSMVASGAQFHLVTTFNEWGEGTSVESAVEWASPSGYGAYLDALHTDGQGDP